APPPPPPPPPPSSSASRSTPWPPTPTSSPPPAASPARPPPPWTTPTSRPNGAASWPPATPKPPSASSPAATARASPPATPPPPPDRRGRRVDARGRGSVGRDMQVDLNLADAPRRWRLIWREGRQVGVSANPLPKGLWARRLSYAGYMATVSQNRG